MQARLNYAKTAPGVYDAMEGLEKYLDQCGLEKPLLYLVQLRASQVNGCAYCLDMHWKDLRATGEKEQRLYSLDAWRECPYYTDRERAALAWAEAVTLIAQEPRAGCRLRSRAVPLQRERIVRSDAGGGRHQCMESSVDCRAHCSGRLPTGQGPRSRDPQCG